MTSNQSPPALPSPRTRLVPCWKVKEMIDSGEIMLDAPYQREVVWETDKMSFLISSMLNNYYVPPILLAVREVKRKNLRVVIDGKQRLTSTARFMRNLLPYIDLSSGESIHRYYYNSDDKHSIDTPEDEALRRNIKPEHFLSQELFDRFNNYEFVMVEYTDISEDEEFDVFARVQLGKPATPNELLKANNTPRAELCRNFMNTYAPIAKLCQNNSLPSLFKTILLILYTLPIQDPKHFNGSPRAITEFVSSHEVPSENLVDKMKKILQVLSEFAANDELKKIVTEFDGKVYHMRPLEVILFGVYVASVQRRRSAENFANDFKNLRNFIMDKREGRMYVGKGAITQGFTWIEDYLDTTNLRAVKRPQVFYTVDSDDDDVEMKAETLVQEPATRNHHHQQQQQRRSMNGVAVARRGGKSATNFKRL